MQQLPTLAGLGPGFVPPPGLGTLPPGMAMGDVLGLPGGLGGLPQIPGALPPGLPQPGGLLLSLAPQGASAPTGGLPQGFAPPPPNFGGVGPPGMSPAEGLTSPGQLQQLGLPQAAPGPGDPSTNPTLAALLASSTAPAPPPPALLAGSPPGPPPAAPAEQGPTERDRRREAEERAAEAAKLRKEKEAAAAAAKKQKLDEAEKKKCHLHKKPKPTCKFCQRHQELIAATETPTTKEGGGAGGSRRRKLDRAISEDRDSRSGPLELANQKTFGFSGLLQTHVVECAHFKSLLTLETFEQLVDETYQFANSVEPYMANSGTLPSALFCCLYRFFTMGLDSRQLRRLIDSTESPYIRCCGFLYVRFGLPHDQLLSWLTEYILDDEEFKPSPDSEWKTTIGEYVEGLMSQDKYYSTVLPRLPVATKRPVEERLAPVAQYRKRTKANKTLIETFRDPGLKVEASIGGDWLHGTLIELEEDPPTRMKVRIRLDDGSEEYVHIGKVILSDGKRGRSRSRGRGGRRSRSRSPHVDWSRNKGRSDNELIDEMRSREREKAVCSTGKDYARKPVGYKAACALPREQGQASYRLMEEETFVPMNRQKRTRSPSPEGQNFGRPKQSAEHQARMQQLFEKYGNAKSAEGSSSGAWSNEVDRPDVMRLG